MAVDRLDQDFNLNTGHHLYVLYGPGIQDTFVARDFSECDLETVLWRFLHEQGFERIVFYAPHRGLYFRDRGSHVRSRPPSPQSSATMVDPNFPSIPLPGLRSPQGGPETGPGRGGTDLQDIDDIHFMMKDAKWRSAVVFPQTENTIHHFDRIHGPARKRFFGLASEWARLPFSNRNACFWLCGGTAEALHEAVKDTLPELHLHLETRRDNPCYSVHRIGGPRRDEVDRLIDHVRLCNGVCVNWKERETLCRLMEAEGCDARLWMGRLCEAQELSREAAKKASSRGENARWFASMPDDDRTAEQRLDSMTGLHSVKQRVHRLKSWAATQEKRRRDNKAGREQASRLHLVFKGNPGTGKTTVARLMGEILRDAGILRRGHCVEVAKASELIGMYVGHTAVRTHERIDEALDGVLFIDEAYQLADTNRGAFGMEAIHAILTRTENDRGRLVVVVAGYLDEMDVFINADPGLRRRFPRNGEIIFEDFTSAELLEIFSTTLKDANRSATPEAIEAVGAMLEEMRRHDRFGNAGEVHNLYNAMVENWSVRVEDGNLSLEEPLRPEDLLT